MPSRVCLYVDSCRQATSPPHLSVCVRSSLATGHAIALPPRSPVKSVCSSADGCRQYTSPSHLSVAPPSLSAWSCVMTIEPLAVALTAQPACAC
eukprot:940474-Prymnesium_polylepis.1